MNKKLLFGSAIGLFAVALFAGAFLIGPKGPEIIGEEEGEYAGYDRPDLAKDLEFIKTVDLKLGYVPTDRLLSAINAAAESKAAVAERQIKAAQNGQADGSETETAPQLLNWIERGPNSDTVGPSNGNTRANSAITAGRIRAVLVDANDATGKTVLVGGVNGGIWKTTDITATNPNWILVNDFLSNMAVTDIAQDPRPGFQNIMYFGTGEANRNADSARGTGVFKSVDSGATWSYLPGSAGFIYCSRILVDGGGNVYLGTRLSGLRRSADGGASWTNITPSGLPATDVADMELSSTGRLHVSFGFIAAGDAYRFTDTPSTASAGAGWTAPTTPYTSFGIRTELAVSGDTLYACPANTSYQVPTIWKSTDGGVTWAATLTQPTANWASGQAWYSLSLGINPTDANQVIVGGLDTHKSLTGGATWTKMSEWVGLAGQYVHADQHKAIWYDNGNKLILASDGGIFYSDNGGIVIRDRNTGLRLKQFYSVAMHPAANSNYFLAGAQDNGTHALNSPGVGASVEVTGGDGAFVGIDQDTPNNQFGAYIFSQYRFSTNGGSSWSSRNFSSTAGRFINPFEVDSAANIVYAADVTGSYRRWPNAPTGTTSNVIAVTGMSGQVSSIAVSPFTANRIYFGTAPPSGGGKIYRVDNANSVASPATATDLSVGLAASTYISNISFGTTENNMIVSVSNYGTNNVLISNNGGATWVPVDGNLPDMPVRWALFRPGSDTQAIIGTEAGVWETGLLNGTSTVWTADPTFPTVRVDMIRYRASDGIYAAGTHGRGVWSTTPVSNVSVSGRVLTSDGRGIRNARVTITDQIQPARTVFTGPLGNYRFDDLPTGQTYTITVNSRRFSFNPVVVNLTGGLSDFNIVASGSGARTADYNPFATITEERKATR